MKAEGVERRLTTIVSVDVAGAIGADGGRQAPPG